MTGRVLIAVGVAALCFGAVPARADIITFEAGNTELLYTASTTHANITETTTSALDVRLMDNSANIIDTTSIANGAFDLLASLDFTGSGSNWSATGTVTLTDTSLNDRVEATFSSTSIALTGDVIIDSIFMHELTITGELGLLSPNSSLLVPTTNPWTFQGDSSSISADPAGFRSGAFVSFNWQVDSLSDLDLATFFGDDRDLPYGTTALTVVPAPLAVLLGLLGLGTAGLKLRKFV